MTALTRIALLAKANAEIAELKAKLKKAEEGLCYGYDWSTEEIKKLEEENEKLKILAKHDAGTIDNLSELVVRMRSELQLIKK